jgi:hypothetical protein
MFGQSLLVKYFVKTVLNDMGADPVTQSIVASGFGWMAAALTCDHHSQILGHVHDVADHTSNLLDVGSAVTEHTATVQDLVHDISTNSHVLSFIAENASEHTATLPELVHNITTNSHVLSLVAEYSYTNPLMEASALVADELRRNHHDLFWDSFSSNQSVHHVDYRSGEIFNGVDVQLNDAHRRINDLYQKFHNYPLLSTKPQWQKIDDFLKRKLSFSYQAGEKLDLSKLLTGWIDLSRVPTDSTSTYTTMFSNFEELYRIEPYLALEAVKEIPVFKVRCGFTAYIVGHFPGGTLIAQALGTL